MKRKVLYLLSPAALRCEKLPNLLFITILVFLQSLLYFPFTGQNGISSFQSNPDRTEVAAKKSHNKPVSVSFIKVFLQLNNSFQDISQHQMAWLQNQFLFSLEVKQSFHSIKFHPAPLLLFLQYNVIHANQKDYIII